MGGTVELADVHHVVLVFQHRRLDQQSAYCANDRLDEQYLIVVHVQIVGGREYGNETWEASGLAFAVHSVPVSCNVMATI